MILSQSAVTIYNGYNVASTNYVYTSNASTGADDGWYSCRADRVLAQTCLATKTSYGVIFRIEGRNNTYTRPGDIYSATVSSQQSIDEMTVVNEKVKEIRIGVKLATPVSSPTASPHNFHCGLILTETN